jgi:hypothetical protein
VACFLFLSLYSTNEAFLFNNYVIPRSCFCCRRLTWYSNIMSVFLLTLSILFIRTRFPSLHVVSFFRIMPWYVCSHCIHFFFFREIGFTASLQLCLYMGLTDSRSKSNRKWLSNHFDVFFQSNRSSWSWHCVRLNLFIIIIYYLL